MAATKQFAAGELICKKGVYESFMYVIKSGKAAVYADYGTPEQTLLTTLEAGAVVGEMGLLEAMPRSADVVALEPVTAEIIDAKNFSEAFQDNEEIIFGLLRSLSDRLTQLTDDYMDACVTIASYVKAEETGAEKPAGLLAKIKAIINRG